MSDTRRAILDALADGPVSGTTLADRLDVTRAAVWKQIETLRSEGFVVESVDEGYLVAEPPAYGGLAVEWGLDAPFRVEYHDEIASTNDRARELARAGETDVVVLADRQTGGRGRLDRAWDSPSGGVWASVVLRPTLPPARAPLLTLAGAVAVADAAREAGADARIKWPNDVVIPESQADDPTTERYGGRKLAGVLTEMQGEADSVAWVVLGLGINADVARADLPAGATSLRAAVGDVDRRVFVQRVLETLADLRDDPDAVVDRWRERSITLGARVRIDTARGPVTGEALDVTDTGALVIDTGDGRTTVHEGDCEHLRSGT